MDQNNKGNFNKESAINNNKDVKFLSLKLQRNGNHLKYIHTNKKTHIKNLKDNKKNETLRKE